MTPAAHHLLRALYLHALAPSTANQDAVRAAGAALDTETARKLNAPKSDIGIPISEQNQGVGGELKIQPSPPVDTIVAEVRADLLARSERGIAKYGVTLDRTDLGLREWLEHAYFETLDKGLYLKRAMRELDAPQATPQPDLATQLDWHEERVDLPPAQLNRKFCKVIRETPDTAPVEPPHAAAPFLAPLTPEPAEAVLGRAGEALAGSLPVYVLAGTGRHPYGDDAWHMETDGVARLFPSKEAAQRWLAAMGRAPV